MAKQYTSNFYKERQKLTRVSAETILSILYSKIKPISVVDFGCGTGTWLAACKRLGSKHIVGIDGAWVDSDLLEIDPSEFWNHDFGSKKFKSLKKYDLALCIEVIEHIEPKMGDLLLESLTEASDFILFSGAIIGQRGTIHRKPEIPTFGLSRLRVRLKSLENSIFRWT